MKKSLFLISIIFSLNIQANILLQYGDELIQRPFDNTPILLIDKEKWYNLLPEEQNEIINTLTTGSGCGNGGHLLQCQGKSALLLDYFEASLPTPTEEDTLINIEEYDLIDYFKKVFAPFAYFNKQFSKTLELIGPPSSWISGDIKTTLDIKQAYQIEGKYCSNAKLQQVALRQNHTVYVNPDLFHLLSPKQQQLLWIHETLYYLGEIHSGMSDSILVRQIIRQALQKEYFIPTKIMPIEKMRQLVSNLMGKKHVIRYTPSWLNSQRIQQIKKELATPIVNVKMLNSSTQRYSCAGVDNNTGNRFEFSFHFMTDYRVLFNTTLSFPGFADNRKNPSISTMRTIFFPELIVALPLNTNLIATFYEFSSIQFLIEINQTDSSQKEAIFGICQ